MTRSHLLGSLRGMLELASDDELATLHHLAMLLHRASHDERGVVSVVAARLMGKGRESYGPLYTRNDARDFQHEQSTEAIDALIYWAADVIQKSYRPELDSATTTLCRATPATSSADSYGDTFLPPPDDRSTAVPHAVSGGGSFSRQGGGMVDAPAIGRVPNNGSAKFSAEESPMSVGRAGSNPAPDTTNRLGRACTDCGAGDGESHSMGCPWITEVTP